jgi:hypothetical protein
MLRCPRYVSARRAVYSPRLSVRALSQSSIQLYAGSYDRSFPQRAPPVPAPASPIPAKAGTTPASRGPSSAASTRSNSVTHKVTYLGRARRGLLIGREVGPGAENAIRTSLRGGMGICTCGQAPMVRRWDCAADQEELAGCRLMVHIAPRKPRSVA